MTKHEIVTVRCMDGTFAEICECEIVVYDEIYPDVPLIQNPREGCPYYD